MEKSNLKELHYITHIDNVASIMEKGILSHNRTKTIKHKTVSMKNIQEKREKVTIPNARPLHDYVNFYINGRNKMLFLVKQTNNVDDICIISVSTDVLELPNVVISDQNAASDYVRFYNVIDGLAKLDYDYIFSDSWTNPDDQAEAWRHGSAMCAEVLIPDTVPSKHIKSLYVLSGQCEQKIKSLGLGLTIEVKPYLFFN